MSAAWLLCVLIDRNTPDPAGPVCTRYESAIACNLALGAWLKRGYEWERRSHLEALGAVFATCGPIKRS